MKTIYENWSARVFPGFYDSILYHSDLLYCWDSNETPEGFTWDFTEGGFGKYAKKMCEAWCKSIADNFTDNPLGLKVGKYRSMWSPKEYNFTTDKISFSVEVNLNDLKKYCLKERRDNFDAYLRKYWSDRDGFWSFIPNNARQFERDYRIGSTLCTKSDLIQVMVEWYLLEFVDFEYVEQETIEAQWEALYENITLQSEDDWSLWDFEYTDNGYKPTKKIA